MYGYRSDEVELKKPDRPDLTLISLRKSFYGYDKNLRPPVAKSILPHIKAIPPKPDNTHPISLMDGMAKRMAYKPPQYDPEMRQRFKKFVLNWVRTNLVPLDEFETFDVQSWLDETNYPLWRKKEILDLHEQFIMDPDNLEVRNFYFKALISIFTKEEYYEEYKHHRGIWARSDLFKAIAGPIFRKIEDQLFKLKYFIKKIPKKDRPAYIVNMMQDYARKYQLSDYTSFESQFTTDMMDDCEFTMYRYMVSNNKVGQWYIQFIFDAIASDNLVMNKFFRVLVKAKRMSGEMNTSLGNSFSNLMFMLFAFDEYKIDYLGPVVEGDDGLVAVSGSIPQEYFPKMGLNVKMVIVPELSVASFCGIIFDPLDEINIRDPREPLCTTFWVPKRYALCGEEKYYQLIRSKALSLIFEYPGCPILYKLGRKLFEILHNYEVLQEPDRDSYKMYYYKQAYEAYCDDRLPHKDTGIATRILMSDQFGISISEQLAIEREIDNITITAWDCPIATSIMPGLWVHNYDVYVREIFCQTEHSLRFPNFVNYPVKIFNRVLITSSNNLYGRDKITLKKYKKILEDNNYVYDQASYLEWKDYSRRYEDAQTRLNNNKKPM